MARRATTLPLSLVVAVERTVGTGNGQIFYEQMTVVTHAAQVFHAGLDAFAFAKLGQNVVDQVGKQATCDITLSTLADAKSVAPGF